ncbi:SN-glycerol-3-phosphate transporter permease [Halorubrum persicum]|uniref:SN-glycerol-3-phosphate transporter permease n=1 Tax=Halorubrum persicum TaxID=1383844 RepID=A0A2G1WMB7_9EURY|nr:carbohydrate ABC transporter permease [Halorubrum persicum]PHQ40158.1 SN-glycerol-3-phosphate transporter permease [Halorubrum persicum]
MSIREYFSGRDPATDEDPSDLTTTERGLLYAALGLVTLLVVFPFYWMVSTSLKTGEAVTQFPPTLIPDSPSLVPYLDALANGMWVGWFVNTIIVSAGATVLVVVVSTPAAYALSRREIPGARLFLMLFLSTLMVPTQALVLPLFVLFSDLGIVNTHVGLILCYAMLFTGFAIFLLYGFFNSLPNNLEEAARVGGIPEWKVFLRVILPLTKPGIATAAIFVFVFSWNEFLFALVFMQDTPMYTISVGLATFFGNRGSVVLNQLMAVSILAVIPVLLLFAVSQERFIKGISGGFED